MDLDQALKDFFPEFVKRNDLKDELKSACEIHHFKAGTCILNINQYIKVIPLVINGVVKVMKDEKEYGQEVLLYYIKPGESCVISITTMVRNAQSQIKAVIEEDADIIILPADKALKIAQKYKVWNAFVYQLFNDKFEELSHIIELLTFSRKDKRLLDYLTKKARLNQTSVIKKTHQQIADDLGSSREVISRLLKKLEHEGHIFLRQGEIEVIDI